MTKLSGAVNLVGFRTDATDRVFYKSHIKQYIEPNFTTVKGGYRHLSLMLRRENSLPNATSRRICRPSTAVVGLLRNLEAGLPADAASMCGGDRGDT
jgi:hypothetical protein